MTHTQHLVGDMAWPDIPLRPTVLIPIGSTEQHGPHLASHTDATVASAVALAVAQQSGGNVVVAPTLNYGSSGEHQSFPGTVSIGSEVLRLLILELVRSTSSWAGRVIFVNAHGGNISALSQAVRQLISEQHNVAWLPCVVAESDLHAGRTETSLMLYLRPDTVRLNRLVAGETRPLSEIFQAMVAGGVSAVSASGVLGDPTGASVAEGQQLLKQMTDDAARRIVRGTTNTSGMLALNEKRVDATCNLPTDRTHRRYSPERREHGDEKENHVTTPDRTERMANSPRSSTTLLGSLPGSVATSHPRAVRDVGTD